jgi:O-methyltransferase involved in polyketide biosynthesis
MSHPLPPQADAWNTANIGARARQAEDSWIAAQQRGVTQYIVVGAGPDPMPAGFDVMQPACFSWLGGSMYLKPDEVMRILSEIGASVPGSSIVFDYCLHRRHLNNAQCAELDLAAPGSPPHSSFEPQLLEHMLRHHGFRHIEHLSPPGLRGIFRMLQAII